MGNRGRTSAAALSVVPSAEVVEMPRALPPDELTDEQAAEWRAVVDRLPADWFQRETYPLLTAYCRHVVAMRHVSQLIDAAESEEELDVVRYDRLLKMQEREGRAMSSLATRMRITQQSTYDPKKKKPVQNRKPWEEVE